MVNKKDWTRREFIEAGLGLATASLVGYFFGSRRRPDPHTCPQIDCLEQECPTLECPEPEVEEAKPTLEEHLAETTVLASIEGRKNILQDEIVAADRINVSIELINAQAYANQDLKVRYWMLTEDQVKMPISQDRSNYIHLGERSDLEVNAAGKASLTGLFKYDPSLSKPFELGTPKINPLARTKEKELFFLVDILNDEDEIITSDIWGKDKAISMKFNPSEKNHTGDKQVFMYEQLFKSDSGRKMREVSDVYQPHFYDAGFSAGKIKIKQSLPAKRLSKTELKAYKAELKAEAKSRGMKITPMMSSFKAGEIKKIIKDGKRSAKEIADLVRSEGWDGINIDFESVRVNARHSKDLTNFMKHLRKELPQGQYEIGIAVSPRYEGSSKKGYKHHGFYDFEALQEHVDTVQIMAYAFHNSKRFNSKDLNQNAVMPEDKLRRIAKYAVDHLDRDKIVMLLPFYGYSWNRSNRKGRKNLTCRNTTKLMEYANNTSDGVVEYRNGELYIRTGSIHAFTQDEKTAKARHDMMDDFGIFKVGYWQGCQASKEVFDEVARWRRE